MSTIEVTKSTNKKLQPSPTEQEVQPSPTKQEIQAYKDSRLKIGLPDRKAIGDKTRTYEVHVKGLKKGQTDYKQACFSNHLAYNYGIKAVTEKILTLLGGIGNTATSIQELTNALITTTKGQTRTPTKLQIADRRIMLAMSWLSVESLEGAPNSKYFVQHEVSPKKAVKHSWQTIETLKDILHERGVPSAEIDSWVTDCAPTLLAQIREDAVWVNRAAMYKDQVANLGEDFTQEAIWEFVGLAFKGQSSFLKPFREVIDPNKEEKKKKTSRAAPKNLSQDAKNWLVRRFPGGVQQNFVHLAASYRLISSAIQQLISKTSDQEANGNEIIEQIAELMIASEQAGAGREELYPKTNNVEGIVDVLNHFKKLSTKTIPNKLAQLSKSASVSTEELQELVDLLEKTAIKCDGQLRTGRQPYSDQILKELEQVLGTELSPTGSRRRTDEFSAVMAEALKDISKRFTNSRKREQERFEILTEARSIRSRVPEKAAEFLDKYCEENGGFGQRLRFSLGDETLKVWKKVLAAWSEKRADTPEKREVVLKELQDIGKFERGFYYKLFAELATEEGTCVWQKDEGVVTDNYLIDYFTAHKKERFAYRGLIHTLRHTDPILSPKHCQFGTGSFPIKWDILKLCKRTSRKPRVKDGQVELSPNQVRLELLGTNGASQEVVRFQSQRFHSEIMRGARIEHNKSPGEQTTIDEDEKDLKFHASRRTRAAMAALGLPRSYLQVKDLVHVENVFGQQSWSARLRLTKKDLKELKQIARNTDLSERDRQQKLDNKLQRSHWKLMVSLKLASHGPFSQYALKHGFSPNHNFFAPHLEANKTRAANSLLRLSRLPAGFRTLTTVLSDDNFSAACSVLQTCSKTEVDQLCEAAQIKKPDPDQLYFYLKPEGSKGQGVFYRRIGPDQIEVDGELQNYPAPWIRVERQFSIRLPGEYKSRRIRKASIKELAFAEDFYQWIGKRNESRLPDRFDNLQSKIFTTTKSALADHKKLATVAYWFRSYINPDANPEAKELHKKEKRQRNIRKALGIWVELAYNGRFENQPIKAAWETKIAPLLGEPAVKDNRISRNKRRLTALTKDLVDNPDQCEDIRNALTEIWRTNDQEWNQHIQKLYNWVLRGKIDPSDHSVYYQNSGGLSLNRIARINELYEDLLKAFYKRNTPDSNFGPNPPMGFASQLLEMRENINLERRRQIAARITKAALDMERPKRTRRRVLFEENKTPQPCHAVIFANASAPAGQDRKGAKRRKIQIAEKTILHELKNSLDLHGIHLIENKSRQYATDSRTGVAGMRVSKLEVSKLVDPKAGIYEQYQKAMKRCLASERDLATIGKTLGHHETTAADDYLVAIMERWDSDTRTWTDSDGSRWKLTENGDYKLIQATKEFGKNKPKPSSVLVPDTNGSLFISSDYQSPYAKPINAFINASLNLAYRHHTEPDWEPHWTTIDCKLKDQKPKSGKYQSATVIDHSKALQVDLEKLPKQKKTAGKSGKKDSSLILVRDLSNEALSGSVWKTIDRYWNEAQANALANILDQMNPIESDQALD